MRDEEGTLHLETAARPGFPLSGAFQPPNPRVSPPSVSSLSPLSVFPLVHAAHVLPGAPQAGLGPGAVRRAAPPSRRPVLSRPTGPSGAGGR